jgi:hypothetical protein
MSHEQMHKFVHHNILKTGRGLLREFKIDPNAARTGCARAPFGFHEVRIELALSFPPLQKK